MKKIICLLILSCTFHLSYTQDNGIDKWKELLFPFVRPYSIEVDCSPVSTNCNFFRNNDFSASTQYNPNNPQHYTDPFHNNLVPEWLPACGSPCIYDGINFNDPPPPLSTGYAVISTLMDPWGILCEGIAQKIPTLTSGNNYLFSFFKRKKDFPPPITNAPVDNFYIVLMHCSDYAQLTPTLYDPPPIPTNRSQVIYCEKTVINTAWEQVVLKFTPNDNYDMAVIYVEQDGPLVPNDNLGCLLITSLELIDATNFSAGPPPNPIPGQCNVTIGPNCVIKNASFSWVGPTGPIANTNQHIQVDASIQQNIGLWTTTMTIPSATITNSLCGIQGTQVSASGSVNVPACGSGQWPKIYEATESERLKIDNNGNIFYLMYLQNMLNNINHIGATTSMVGDFYVHYNKTTGLTNWIGSDWGLHHTLSSGAANFYNNPQGNIYRDGSTGNQVSGPINVPLVDKILVEDNGAFITQTGYNGWGSSFTINSYSPSSNLPVSSILTPSIPGYMQEPFAGNGNAIYNPANHRLFVGHYYWNGAQGYIYRLAIYYLDPVTYVLSAVNNPANNPINGPIVQVNSSEKIFVYNVSTQSLEEYDPLTGLPTTLVINNFFNNSLEPIARSNQTLDDRILIKNTSQLYFYYINTTVPYTATKIQYTPPSPMSQFYSSYVFDGNEVFIAGEYMGNGFTIGNQVFPLLGSGSAFLTKFNVSTDFNRLGGDFFAKGNDNIAPENSSERIEPVNDELQLFPNPAKQILQVVLNNNTEKEAPLYFISVTNSAGARVITTFSNKSMTMLDVSLLKPGIYYVNVTAGAKKIATKAFLKE